MSAYSDFRMPGNVRFGVQSLQSLPEEVTRFSPSRIALVSDKGLEGAGVVGRIVELLERLHIPLVVFTDIQGEPTFKLLAGAVDSLRQESCDLVVGIGGGSAMDMAKTIAALLDKSDIAPYISGEKAIENRSVPCILLPTTSGTGAEMTMNAIFGDDEQELKRGLVSPALLPDVAIIDPMLTVSCPARVTAASGVDAFTHAIESYVAVRATPATKMYAEQAMKLFPAHIARAVHHGSSVDARIGMSLVSNWAGISLANAGVGAVHALAYPLGGKFHIEHGIANALLMPFVFEVTGKTCTEQMVNIAGFLQLGDYGSRPHEALQAVTDYMFRLLGELDLPTSLSGLGVDEAALPVLAEQASKIDRLLLNTPYKLNKDKILRIYEKAYRGV
ncbi:iron-containing alcohol dehydrogenase [Paenibacillus hamazuiensis]|uniref:iron-containing alcohol dehydrogenase n=1 Tax=Paenibacillus hamazuiensis TaxID=2936508 RepID=UPI00200F078C|nr:iron-containing alcohol dehydrogenase [Paenibacillus hamazuiensis]